MLDPLGRMSSNFPLFSRNRFAGPPGFNLETSLVIALTLTP